MENDPEFPILNYDTEVQKIKDSVDRCRSLLNSNSIQAIPNFNEILNRELEAITDILAIGHFHAAARCTRAAIELTAANLCLYHKLGGSGRLTDISFSKKYRVSGLTNKKDSPLLKLVKLGIIDDPLFSAFRVVYGDLSCYVHYRVSYYLIHVMPERLESEYHYAETLRLSEKNDETGKTVKATMVKLILEPAFFVLEILLKCQ